MKQVKALVTLFPPTFDILFKKNTKEIFSRDSDLTTSVVRPSLCDQNLKTSLNQSFYHQECYNKGHEAS